MKPFEPRGPAAWQELQRFKRGLLPAMQEAISPAVASFLSYFPGRNARILVLTREPGAFKRDYLQPTNDALKKLGAEKKIELEEFDFSRLATAKQTAKWPGELQKLPFQDGRFDLVFGHSALHHGSIRR